jgi:hypothetical protein
VPEHPLHILIVILTLERRDASTDWYMQGTCICVHACAYIDGSGKVTEGRLDIFPGSGGSRNFEKGGGGTPERRGAPPEIAKNSRILGFKS